MAEEIGKLLNSRDEEYFFFKYFHCFYHTIRWKNQFVFYSDEANEASERERERDAQKRRNVK